MGLSGPFSFPAEDEAEVTSLIEGLSAGLQESLTPEQADAVASLLGAYREAAQHVTGHLEDLHETIQNQDREIDALTHDRDEWRREANYWQERVERRDA